MPVECRDDEVIPITFTKPVLSYNVGEVAAFLPEVAQQFIDGEVAVLGDSPAKAGDPPDDDEPAPEAHHSRRRSKS
jgi:hypothetical protein